MPHRTLTDLLGRAWQVWETRPGPRSRVSDVRRDGWITFEAMGSPMEKRRMAPIPNGWEAMDDESLLLLLTRATPVGRRSRTGAREEREELPDESLERAAGE
jgi:hypothetical protein